MAKACERCGAPPPVVDHGPWAGQTGMHDYCGVCSRDLCQKCMAEGCCPDSTDGKHHPDLDEDNDEHEYESL